MIKTREEEIDNLSEKIGNGIFVGFGKAFVWASFIVIIASLIAFEIIYVQNKNLDMSYKEDMKKWQSSTLTAIAYDNTTQLETTEFIVTKEVCVKSFDDNKLSELEDRKMEKIKYDLL